MISKIIIENVKGFGSPAYEMTFNLLPGKPNIVVAPNGFGKSSLCKAFDCLTSQGIILNESDYHKNNKNANPSLTVEYNDVLYTTDCVRNEVFSKFQCYCINSPIKASSVTKRIGGAYNKTQNFLSVEDVVLLNNTPIDKSISYSSSKYKDDFGLNGKILPNINSELKMLSSFPFAEMDAFGGSRKWTKVLQIVGYLNSLSGTAEDISASVDDSIFDEIYGLPEYTSIDNCIRHFFSCPSKLDVFLRFWILNKIYFTDKHAFKQFIKRNEFDIFVNNLNDSLKALDTTWSGLKAIEDSRKLLIHFPKADSISYGQRDSLFLFASLERIKTEMNYDKPVILVVDELFDYLDDVNMTIIQYFFSEFISFCKSKVEIYPILLTHLSPEFYHNYTFANMNIQYLGFGNGVASTPTKRLLQVRGDKPGESPLYEEVSKYLLHYNTETINNEAAFETYGLRKKWGRGYGFWEYLAEECCKYFSEQQYDYYAISTAVRIRVEKLMYDSIKNEENRKAYLSINGTKKKIEYLKDIGVETPDVYSLLGIIYNDAEHLPKDVNKDKPIIYRLNVPMIRHIIHRLFNEEFPITIEHLK